MKFIAILVAVVFYRAWFGGHPLRDRVPLGSFTSRLADYGLNGVPYLAVATLGPAIALILLLWITEGLLWGLVHLVIGVLVLLFCVQHEGALSGEDAVSREEAVSGEEAVSEQEAISEAPEEAPEEGPDVATDQDGDDSPAAETRMTANASSLSLAFRMFRALHPAIFWFLLLGPVGALVYALLRHCAGREGRVHNDADFEERDIDGPGPDEPDDLNDDSRTLADVALDWAEWLPVRVTGLICAMLGDFTAGSNAWLDHLLMADEPPEESLNDFVVASLGAPKQGGALAVEKGDSDDSARQLMERATWGWLAIAAIVTIVG